LSGASFEGIGGLQDANDTAQDAELELSGLPALLAIGGWIRVKIHV
jgi:hypothetical protein